MNKLLSLNLLGAIMLLSPSFANAALVIDFSNADGVQRAGWEILRETTANFTLGPVSGSFPVDSSVASSGTVTVSVPFADGRNRTSSSAGHGSVDASVTDLFNDHFFRFNTVAAAPGTNQITNTEATPKTFTVFPGILTISGLNPGADYTIGFWSFDRGSGISGGKTHIYTALVNNENTNQYAEQYTAFGTPANSLSDYYGEGTFTTNIAGELQLRAAIAYSVPGNAHAEIDGAQNAPINGLSITLVPEPSTYAAIAAGALLLLTFLRKRIR